MGLNPQKLRNALYPGELNGLLIRLARSKPFTTTWNIPPYQSGEEEQTPESLEKNTLYRSMADAELVLRFFALQDAISNNKRGSLRRILDRFMRENKNIEQAESQKWEKKYKHILDQFVSIFDGAPFRLSGTSRPSRPLYDALMVAASLNENIDILEKKCKLRRIYANLCRMRKIIIF